MLKIANGNSKIGKDTLIMNITSATDCASAKLGLCKVADKCYALKPERMYPNCIPSRNEQTKAFDSLSAHEIALELIKKVKTREKRNASLWLRNKPMLPEIKYLRFSEAGDFRTQADIEKISTIADLLREYNVRVYGYTARKDLTFTGISDNMTVNGSGFMIHNNFKAVKKAKTKLVCIGSCIRCKLCTVRHGETVEIVIH